MISLIALVLLTPVLITIIFILRISAEGEVFYLQERMGYQNKKFKIIKFATMLKNSETMGNGLITLKNDFRVTTFGKVLRQSKANELPQLINILIGDISFVGPRPLAERTFKDYPKNVQNRIYKSKPGLTGIGSIFFRDEESILSSLKREKPQNFYKRVIAPYKGELELWYLQKKSFMLDFILILLTVLVVFFPKTNIYKKLFSTLPLMKNNFLEESYE